MLIDWFTVLAQIVNFLILVGLLKYFLYGRILSAIEERERKISTQVQEAEARSKDAEQEAASYRQKSQELEKRKEELLNQAKHEADVQRAADLQRIREEVNTIRRRWHETIAQEKTAFLQHVRRCTVAQVYEIARRALQDLANEELERHFVKIFLERVEQWSSENWDALRESIGDSQNPIVVQSAFALPQATQQQITQVFWERLRRNIPMTFETVPDLVCGIEVRTIGHTMAWRLESYLQSLEEHLSRVMDEGGQGKMP